MEQGEEPRLNVVHVVARMSDTYGGVSTAVASLAALAAETLNTRIATVADATGGRENIERIQATTPVLEFRGSPIVGRWHGSLGLVIWLCRVRRLDAIVAHSFFDFAVLAAFVAATLRRKPLIIMPHGSLDPFDMKKHARAKQALFPLWACIARRADCFWTTTALEAERLKAFTSRSPRHLIGLPAPPAVHCVPSREAARAELGLLPESFAWLFLGRIDHKKGLVRLLEAYDAIWQEGDTLLIAGSGDRRYEDFISSRIGALTRGHDVRLLGWLDASGKATALAAADTFVLASDNENFGLSVLEALTAGLPVIASDEVYVARDLARDRAVALCMTSTASLIEVMRTVRHDPDARHRLRVLGPKAAATYSNEQVASRLIESMGRVLNGRRAVVRKPSHSDDRTG